MKNLKNDYKKYSESFQKRSKQRVKDKKIWDEGEVIHNIVCVSRKNITVLVSNMLKKFLNFF